MHVFKDYAAKNETIHNSKVVTLYCNNGGEAILTTIFSINKVPTKVLPLNAIWLWNHKKPRLEYPKEFGFTTFVHIKTRNGKFDDKFLKPYWLGMNQMAKNWGMLWNVMTETFITARDIMFHVTTFKVTGPVKNELPTDELNDTFSPENNKGQVFSKLGIESPREQSFLELRRNDWPKNRPSCSHDENTW